MSELAIQGIQLSGLRQTTKKPKRFSFPHIFNRKNGLEIIQGHPTSINKIKSQTVVDRVNLVQQIIMKHLFYYVLYTRDQK